jgi:hypothetical protein
VADPWWCLCVQLFGLVNTLLANARASAELDLAIQRYSVIPLSPNSGLIGWVPNCDTLHQLIREYRDQRKVGRRNWTHPHFALLNKMPRMGYSISEGSCSEQKSTRFTCFLHWLQALFLALPS